MSLGRRYRVPSLGTIVIALILTVFYESRITRSLVAGGFNFKTPDYLQEAWLVLRIGSIVLIIVFWILNQNNQLNWMVILANTLLTLGLLVNIVAMVAMLLGSSHIKGSALLIDAAILATVNILTFSIWYWLIDPPGIDESHPTDAPWEFLFPQRANRIPGYEAWVPRYTDYVALAFSTSVAFSPTDTAPLTRRAKGLMVFQAAISLVTITVIAGSAINILASG